MPMKDIDSAYAQMRNVWETPEDAMQQDYSEPMRTLLKNSVLLFTESGDGYGGLLLGYEEILAARKIFSYLIFDSGAVELDSWSSRRGIDNRQYPAGRKA